MKCLEKHKAPDNQKGVGGFALENNDLGLKDQ